jgi:hypothetical protein
LQVGSGDRVLVMVIISAPPLGEVVVIIAPVDSAVGTTAVGTGAKLGYLLMFCQVKPVLAGIIGKPPVPVGMAMPSTRTRTKAM